MAGQGSLVAWTWSCMRPYRGRMAVLLGIAATEIALGLLTPWPLKLLVDNVLGPQPMPPTIGAIAHAVTGNSRAELLFVVVIGGLLLQLLAQLVSLINTQLQVDTGQRMVYSLRAQLLSHLQALRLRHHIVTRTADSVYRLEADAYCVHDLVMSGVFPLVTSVTTLAAMFAILYSRDRSLALLSLTVIPFLYACLRYYSKRMVDRAERVKELESKLVERLYEILSSIKVVKGFAREPHELQRFKSAGHETMSARLRYTWQESLFTLAVTAITMTGTALVLAVGGMHVLEGQLSVGKLLVVTAYLAAVYGPLSSIAHTTGSLQNAIASARRVREIFAHTPEMLDAPDAVDATAITGDVRFENVSFSYTDDRQILRDISFSARPGEVVALVGLTGAGKSTLASLIPRFFEPTSGRVLIDGIDVSRYRLRSLRERSAAVLPGGAPFWRAGAPGGDALRGHGCGQYPVRPPQRDRRGSGAGRPGRPRPRLHHAAAEGLRHAVGRSGREPLGRRAAAARHCPRAAQGCADPDSRRADLVARRVVRGGGVLGTAPP